MAEATSTSTPSRRGMLAGTTAALLGAVSFVSWRSSAASGESQDNDLLILCEEFYRTQAELDHWHATGYRLEPLTPETEAYRLWKAEDDRVVWANHDIFEMIRDMPAKTQAGLVAKSKVFAEQMDGIVVSVDGSMPGASNFEIFAYRLAQNMVQIGGGAA